MRLASGGDVPVHGMPPCSTGTRSTARAAGEEQPGVSPSGGDGHSCRRARYRAQEAPFIQKAGASAGDAGAAGRSGSSQKTSRQVWDRPHGHRGRLQLSSTYFDLPQGAQAVDTVARVDVPLRRNFLFRVDAPFSKWSDSNLPGTTSAQGFSDLAVTAGWRAYNTPEYALLVGVLTTMPTAAETGLGLGKYTVGPTIATARFLPRWESFLVGVFTQQFSVGGDPARNSINRSKIIGQVNSFWAERWWTIVQAVWQVDWERNSKTSMALELEVGRSVMGRLGVFARPGVGIWGQEVPGAYDWNVEVGIRYMFPSF
jgi:hypothetical protein